MNNKKITAILLAIVTIFSILSTSAFAASEANAEVPVKLTVINSYKKISVTVPASLPIEIYNGTVITADNAKITNNSESTSIKINAITLKGGSMSIGNYDSFSGDNSIALKINGISSKEEGKLNINSTAFPNISSSSNLKLEYYAKVSGDVLEMAESEVAEVIFTISAV